MGGNIIARLIIFREMYALPLNHRSGDTIVYIIISTKFLSWIHRGHGDIQRFL